MPRIARTIQELQGRSPDGSQRGGAVAYATIQPSGDVAVGVFTNLGGDQQLRDAVARIAPRIAARYSADEKVD